MKKPASGTRGRSGSSSTKFHLPPPHFASLGKKLFEFMLNKNSLTWQDGGEPIFIVVCLQKINKWGQASGFHFSREIQAARNRRRPKRETERGRWMVGAPK